MFETVMTFAKNIACESGFSQYCPLPEPCNWDYACWSARYGVPYPEYTLPVVTGLFCAGTFAGVMYHQTHDLKGSLKWSVPMFVQGALTFSAMGYIINHVLAGKPLLQHYREYLKEPATQADKTDGLVQKVGKFFSYVGKKNAVFQEQKKVEKSRIAAKA